MKKKLSIVLVVGFALTATMVMVSQVKGACLVEPTSLDFGAFCCDGGYNNLEKTFTITNTGPNSLSGTVTESCEYYSIPDGGGSYTLAAGESRTVTVRFEPDTPGTHMCTIETGSDDCNDVSCVGVGDTTCQLSTVLLYGDVCIGGYKDYTFTITNNGPNTFSGNVTRVLSDSHYSIRGGGGSYTLAAGESRTVTVRFTPTFVGGLWEKIETGYGLCCDVFCYCTGISCCFVWPFSLDFGDVGVGNYQDEVFSINNNGPDTFGGNVTESCEHYSIPDGGGSYTLDPGQSRWVTVRFEPTDGGTHTCDIEPGSAFCSGDVSCTGVGTYISDPDCDAANIDGINPVDFIDCSILASNWRLTGPDLLGDLNTDGIVDINDLGMFAVYWLIDCTEPWPECWSCPRQCYGDADCEPEGIQQFWVSLNDVAILQDAWLTSYPDDSYNPCADFDRDGDVDVDDLATLTTWFNQIPVPADCGPGGTWPPNP